MKSQVTLLLICMLFSKALSLTCKQFIPGTNSPEEITCADQCLTSNTYTSDRSVPVELPVKTCGTPETCVRGSINLGVHKMIANTKCCKTNNCNTESLPALSRQASNGKMCYTCEDDNCTKIVRCEGNEDRCFTASVQQGSNTLSLKGCVTQNYCAASGSAFMSALDVPSMKCCEGNLCNGVEMFTLICLS